MKITIVITDTPDGKCGVEFDFDPAINQDDPGSTPAARLALRVLDLVAEDVITAAKVETKDDDES